MVAKIIRKEWGTCGTVWMQSNFVETSRAFCGVLNQKKKRVGHLMGNKGDDDVQALPGPSVVTCSLIPHDSKTMIFSTVRFTLQIYAFFQCGQKFNKTSALMRGLWLSYRPHICTFSHKFHCCCLFRVTSYAVNFIFSPALSQFSPGEEFRRFVNLQLVTLPLWQHHGESGDGAGVRWTSCSNCCLPGRRSDVG